QREFGIDVASALDSTLFIGDSPNDEPMFAYFPVSVGVANIQSQLHRLTRRPAYVAAFHGGAGFTEMADRLLAARAVTA
ncbi:HAD family hydrolase, partial [Salmonella enterica]|nr:HAD family hydrolase [Salmonella enterica]